MSFYKTSTGKVATGALADAMTPTFGLIPNNTVALASLESIQFDKYQDNPEFINIKWLIKEGKYAGFMVRHKLDVNSTSTEKRDRALNMLVRLFKICEVTPQNPEAAPTQVDFDKCKSKELGIRILQWQSVDQYTGEVKDGNWVSMIYPLSEYEYQEGKFLEAPKSAVMNMQKSTDVELEDVPF